MTNVADSRHCEEPQATRQFSSGTGLLRSARNDEEAISLEGVWGDV